MSTPSNTMTSIDVPSSRKGMVMMCSLCSPFGTTRGSVEEGNHQLQTKVDILHSWVCPCFCPLFVGCNAMVLIP